MSTATTASVGLRRSEFAKLKGVNKSTVTRWGQDGRLVEVGGLIDVEATEARLAATQGSRLDVADRWAQERAPVAPAALEEQPAPGTTQPAGTAAVGTPTGTIEGLDADTIGLRTRHAQMRRAEAEAAGKELERELAAGSVIPLASLKRDLAAAVGIIHQAAENLPDRLAPLLVGQTEQGTVRAILRDAMEELRATAADQLAAVVRKAAP